MTEAACQCRRHPPPCFYPATQEDLLCDHCRAGCVLAEAADCSVHFCADEPGAAERVRRLREMTGADTAMAYTTEYWQEGSAP